MTPLHAWAQRHAITAEALADLLRTLGVGAPEVPLGPVELHSEAWVQQQVRLTAAQQGRLMFRNNVGACEDKDGRPIRYGLCNDSKQMNEKLKSSDLVGITPVVCRCGWLHGVFTAYECKPTRWHMTPGDKRAKAQLNFGQLVVSRGGIFRFVTDPTQI